MHSDRSPTVRTPLCLLTGQPDGQLSSRRGPDISVSNQISPSESLFMCVCVCGRESAQCQVIVRSICADGSRSVCWNEDEWIRDLNKCVWSRLKGWRTCVKQCTNLRLSLPCDCVLVGCKCVVILTDAGYTASFHHLLSHSCEVQSDMRETHKASY